MGMAKLVVRFEQVSQKDFIRLDRLVFCGAAAVMIIQLCLIVWLNQLYGAFSDKSLIRMCNASLGRRAAVDLEADSLSLRNRCVRFDVIDRFRPIEIKGDRVAFSLMT